MPDLSPLQWTAILGGAALFVGVSCYSIHDALNRDFGSTNAKLAWVQLAVLVPFFGGLAYLFFGRNRGRKI
ncbi:MAG: PLD nuclease N-terminal domain-containing protein [Proteobacteria bacterium]|nr:PLD nuclease N-terminal domain-containing protein [Pseudomonadota bacterium]MBU1594233.1 PLD nuclease N-terminal domain-containing protein [Pseudomonadota bacterium]